MVGAIVQAGASVRKAGLSAQGLMVEVIVI
jgi:hypothetical protein